MRTAPETPTTVTTRRPRRSAFLAVVLTITSFGLVAPSPVAAQAIPTGSGGEYHPISPALVLDARQGSTAGPVREPLRSSPAGSRINVPVLGIGEVPADADDVLGLVLNIQVTAASESGVLTVFNSKFRSQPTGTTMAYTAGRPSNSLAIVPPSGGGSIAVTLRSLAAGEASVRITVRGWLSTTSSGERGQRLMLVAPTALRTATDKPLGRNAVVPLQVRGVGAVPDGDDIVGVALNVSVLNTRDASEKTKVSVSGRRVTSAPRQSDMKVNRGQITSSVLFVPLDDAGKVYLSNLAGRTNVIVHVIGFFESGVSSANRRGRIVPLTLPFRVIDTRDPEDAGNVPIGPGVAEEWNFRGTIQSTFLSDGSSIGAVSGVLGTFTANEHIRQYPANPPSSTELRVYPGPKLSTMTNVFVAEGQTASNVVGGRLTSESSTTNEDRITVYNKAGTTHYTYDLSAMVLQN